MASGVDRSKLAMSEARNSLRSRDKSSGFVGRGIIDDPRLIKSNHLETRPNNWEFSDWQPSKPFDGSKRHKKAKANPERQREKDQEKEEAHARSMSQLSTPQGERHKHTPATFPRTKYTMPSQRAALERIKQQITFSDLDDVSTDTERNIERNIPLKSEVTEPPNKMAATARAGSDNNLRGDVGPDTNHIVSRLMEIRDYIKQAMSMMDTLHNTDDPNQATEIGKLRKLIQHLREQERAYMTLLQQLLTLQDEDVVAERGASNVRNLDAVHGKGDYPIDDVMSIDLDIRSVVSEATTEATQSSSSRPRIEDKLGMDVDSEMPNNAVFTDHADVERLVNSLPQWDYVTEHPRDENAVSRLTSTDLGDTSLELETMREQEQLLKRLVDQQEQLRALHGRQEALLAMQKDAEKKLAKTKDVSAAAMSSHTDGHTDGHTGGQTGGQAAGQADERNYGVRECGDVSDFVRDGPKLRRARRHDNKQHNSLSDPETDELWHIPQLEGADGHAELAVKLEKLQAKKRHMNQILGELQSLRSQRYNQLVNALQEDGRVQQISEAVIGQGEDIESTIPDDDLNVVVTRESNEQLTRESDNTQTKLLEVRSCLGQLQDLVRYYDVSNGSVPDRVFNATNRETANANCSPVTIRVSPHAQAACDESRIVHASWHAATAGDTQLARQADDSGSDAGDTQSQQAWGDDPEIRRKVQKLKEAKDRLRALQEIVAKIDNPQCEPSSLLQASNDRPDALSMNNESERSGASIEVLSDGEVPADNPRVREEMDPHQSSFMQYQLDELRQLESERMRLQHLSENLVALSYAKQEKEANKLKGERNNSEVTFAEQPEIESTPLTVTFSSNDELYDKMRKQRILREELRQKKRELESLMRKDRPRRGYAKNQDTQSDTVSTEALGTSVVSADATMATWGGSTTENLESITEDNDACQGDDVDDNRDEDDDYPSDGIVQAEEEEEENEASGGTYTIDDDVRHRRHKRGTKSAGKQTYPRPLQLDHGGRGETRGRGISRDWVDPMQSSPTYHKRTSRDSTASEGRYMDRDGRENSLCQAVLNLSQTIQGYQASHMAGTSPGYSRHMADVMQYQQSLAYRHPHDPAHHSLSETQFDRDASLHAASHPYTPFAYPEPHFYPSPYHPGYPERACMPAGSRTRLNNASQTEAPHVKAASVEQAPGSAILHQRDQAAQTDVGPKMSLSRTLGQTSSRDTADQSTQAEQGGGIRKARATSSLPCQLQPPHQPSVRPGVISSAFCDGASTSGIISSIHGGVRAAQQQLNKASGRDDTFGSMTIFDTLRETIYGEVAALIFHNENRPHFLIELFRDLQLLSTDLLRQRALSALKDVLANPTLRNDIHEHPCETVTTSELTPSENQLPSDEDDYMVCESRNNLNTSVHDSKARMSLHKYMQKVPNGSVTSTPSSLCENPFANDALGDTVITLETSLREMRERDRRQKEAGVTSCEMGGLTQASRSGDMNHSPRHTTGLRPDNSDSSASDSPMVLLDTRRLEQQVQDIMTDIVPVLKENMENVCSLPLLVYIKNAILAVTNNKYVANHSSKLLHHQLAAILHTTLAKYEGIKLRDRSDDLIDDLTEVLYNELAYVRLMPRYSNLSQLSPKQPGIPVNVNDASKLVNYGTESDEVISSSSSSESLSDDDDNVRGHEAAVGGAGGMGREGAANRVTSSHMPAAANGGAIVDAEDKDDGAEMPYKNGFLELTLGETKPFTRIGSDEDDDEEDDESLSADDPSDTAVSRDAHKEQNVVAMDTDDDDGRPNYVEDEVKDADQVGATVETMAAGGDALATERGVEASLASDSRSQNDTSSQSGVVDAGSDMSSMSVSNTLSSVTRAESLVNGNEECEEITEGDLPDRLKSYTQEEWEERISGEQKDLSICGEIAADMNGEITGCAVELRAPTTNT